MSSANLADLVQPLALTSGTGVLVNVPLFATGGAVAVTNGGGNTGIALTVTDTPTGVLTALELKDADAFAVRNKRYDATSGALTYEQLPIAVTSAGRVLVNPPGLLTDDDPRVAHSELTVFGGLSADRVTCGALEVASLTAIGFVYVTAVTADPATGALTVSYSDGSTAALPLPTPPPPPFSPDVQALQFTVDYMSRQVAQLQAAVTQLQALLAVDGALTALPDAGSEAAYAAEIAAALDAARA